MKKLINDPFDFVEEMLEGFCAAHDDLIKRVGRRAIARIDAPIPGKVGVVVGGGSGHLPLYTAFVGKGGADAAPVGNIFASPPAKLSWKPRARQMAVLAWCISMATTPATS